MDRMAAEDGSGALDDLFQRALALLDAGDAAGLARLLAEHPELARERLEAPGTWLRSKIGGALDGFFARPYLLWFVSEDAVRAGRLPANIVEITGIILAAARREAPGRFQEQVDYALSLVCWSSVARTCAVQLALIDVLADAGAKLDGNP